MLRLWEGLSQRPAEFGIQFISFQILKYPKFIAPKPYVTISVHVPVACRDVYSNINRAFGTEYQSLTNSSKKR